MSKTDLTPDEMWYRAGGNRPHSFWKNRVSGHVVSEELLVDRGILPPDGRTIERLEKENRRLRAAQGEGD